MGHLIKQAPWVWSVIEVCSLTENATPMEWLSFTPFLQRMARAYGNEKGRAMKADHEKRQLERDSKRGMKARSRG